MPPPSNKRQKLLASTRPIKRLNNNSSSSSSTTIPPNNNNTTTTIAASSLSSRTTQSIISTHHTLHKQLAQARKRNDPPGAVAALEAAIEANGGLKLYQRASVAGQSRQRGGDTSKVLVDWLDLDLHCHRGGKGRRSRCDGDNDDNNDDNIIRILEVGALSATNALNIPRTTRVRRIDLHSQDTRAIEQVDFMALDPQLPWVGGTGYDIVSLSLVVNYVSDPAARGRMLKRTIEFLHHQHHRHHHHLLPLLPALFLVLPRPCIDNSRYLSEDRLVAIMHALGYTQTRVKRSPRLYYSLWTLRTSSSSSSFDDDEKRQKTAGNKVFKKVEVRSGKDRNNFCIVLDLDDDDDDNGDDDDVNNDSNS